MFGHDVSGTSNVNVSLVEPALEMSTTEHSVMAITIISYYTFQIKML